MKIGKCDTIFESVFLSQSSVALKVVSPLGKTERTLFVRTKEHVYPNKREKVQSVIYEHLCTCRYYNQIDDILSINNRNK